MHVLAIFKILRDQVIRTGDCIHWDYTRPLGGRGSAKKKGGGDEKRYPIRLPAPNFACFPNLFQLKKKKKGR